MAVRTEWTKLITTKAFWWTTALFIIFGAGFSALFHYNVAPGPLGIPVIYAASAVMGIQGLSFLVLCVQAIMLVTSEYRHNYQIVTFLATPNRTVVAVAKWMFAVFGALLTWGTVVLSYYVAKWMGGSVASKTLNVWHDDNALRLMRIYPLVAILLVTMAQGIAYIVRQTAGATTIMLLWVLALESLLSLLPKVGDAMKYGPITNMNAFLTQSDTVWSWQESGVYFAAWAIAIWVIGVFILNKRDA